MRDARSFARNVSARRRRTLEILFGLLAPALLSVLPACARRPTAPPPTADSFPVFVDIAKEAGIDFEHDTGFDGRSWRIVETVNGAVGFLDYDGDGWMDLYFTNGCRKERGAAPPRNALYRNLGGARFQDVSKGSGTDDASLSLGCCVADVDGDGRPDIHVTNLGPNRLYRNNGDGTFTDLAPAAGLALTSMDAGSVLFDMDEDGDLDLYVASYVVDRKTEHPPLVLRGVPGYWPPRNYPGALDHLYENRGDGRFTDVSESSGIRDVPPGRGLGVTATDFNGDGHADIYVANDMSPNFMFFGDGEGRFTENGFLNGTALSEEGDELGSMGVDAGDLDGDGRVDLAVTNYQGQPNNLFRCAAADAYEELAGINGIAAHSINDVAWGVGFFDLDLDGRQDLFISAGHLNPFTHQLNENTTHEQPNRIYRNVGGGRLRDVSKDCGEAFRVHEVSRGAAFGDLDNDGDVDIVVVSAHGAPQVLRNDGRTSRSWVLVRLVGSGLNRDAIGALVSLTAGGRSQWRDRRSAASYISANDPRLHFGLGSAERIERLEVRWPGGRRAAFGDLPARRLITVREEGDKIEVAEPPRSPAG